MGCGQNTTLYIIASTVDEVSAALRSPLARRPFDTTVVLVPHIVPFGVPLDQCGCNLHELSGQFQASLGSLTSSIAVRVCACRDASHIPGRMLFHPVSIVIAGRKGRWWPSAAQRLAQACSIEGHTVSFVDLDRVPGGIRPIRREASWGAS